jgi:hypothetical protein
VSLIDGALHDANTIRILSNSEYKPTWGLNDGVAHPDYGVVHPSSRLTTVEHPLGFDIKAKALGPGLSKTMCIRFENRSEDTYRFYLRAAPGTGKRTLGGKSVETAADTLEDVVDVEVTYKGGTLYSGKLSGSPDEELFSRRGVPLDRIPPFSYAIVQVEISLPKTLGDEYMGSVLNVEWSFTAYRDSPITGVTTEPAERLDDNIAENPDLMPDKWRWDERILVIIESPV